MLSALAIALAVLEFVGLAFFTGQLLRFYAAKGSPFYALACVFACWYLGFFGTLFLPIDIAEAYASRVLVPANVSSVSYTPSLTPSATPSPWNVTASPTPSASPSPSWSSSNSGSPSTTPSWGSSLSNTPSPTGTRSPSGTPTGTRTPSGTPTVSATSTRSVASRTKTPTGSRSRFSASKTPSASSSPGFFCEGACGRALEVEGSSADDGLAGAWLGALWRSLMQGDGGVRRAQGAPFGALPANATNSSTGGGGGGGGGGVMPSPAPNSTAWWVVPPAQESVVRNGPLESMWFAVYWLTAILTYAVVPVVQEYLAAGEFTKRGRLWAAVLINVVFYAAIGAVAFVALGYVVFLQGATLVDLLPALISFANTIGLVIIVLLLGYGAAEVPRSLWRRANPAGELRRLYFKAPEIDGALFDVKQELGDTLTEIAKFAAKVDLMSADKDYVSGPNRDKLVTMQRALEVVNRKVGYAKTVLGKSYGATAASRQAATARLAVKDDADEDEDEKGFFGGFAGMFKGKSNKYKGVSIVKLAALHKRVMSQVATVRKQAFRWESAVLRCIELEYIVAKAVPPVPLKKKTADGATFYVTTRGAGMADVSRTRGARGVAVPPQALAGVLRGFSSGMPTPPGVDPAAVDVLSEKAGLALLQLMLWPTLCGGFFNRLLWRTRIHATPFIYTSLFLFTEIFSLLLMWSEATIWINLSGLVTPNLSVFGLLLKVAETADNYFAILLVSSLPLAYMCLLSMYSVFKLKVFNVLDLSGNQNTDPYSLLVNASLMNRLQFALAFNFLNVLYHSNNKDDFPDTAFLHSVGAKMSLSVLDWYLPVGMVIVYVMCRLDLTDRLLRMLGYEEKGDPIKGSREHDLAVIDGAAVVLRGRAMLGLGGDAMGDEERERANELSRDRTKLIMARAAARREGRNPDEVAPLDFIESSGGGAGGGSSYDSSSGAASQGGDSGPGRPTNLSMASFAGTAKGGAGAPSRMSLAALAARVGMGGGGGGDTGAGAGSEAYGVVDHGDGDPGSGGAEGGHLGPGGGHTHTASGGFSATGSSWGGGGGGGGFGGSSAAAPPPPPMRTVAKPPTLAELLRGGKKPTAFSQLPPSPTP